MPHRVTLIPGDGIGPELSAATRRVLEATGVEFDWDVREAGADVMAKHGGNPLPDSVIESIAHTGVAIKGPITTPVGTGFRSVNVALRKALDLFAQVRPCKSYAGVRSRYERRRPRDRAREHRGPLRRHRVRGGHRQLRRPARHDPEALGRRDPRGRRHLDQADLDRGHAPRRAVRARLRPPRGTPQGHGRPQGQHHEAHRRPLAARRARGRRGLQRHRVRGSHRRQHVHAARAEARAVRRHGAARTSTATSSPTSPRAWSAASAWRPAPTTAARPRCSSRRTARRPSTPARTRPTRRR